MVFSTAQTKIETEDFNHMTDVFVDLNDLIPFARSSDSVLFMNELQIQSELTKH